MALPNKIKILLYGGSIWYFGEGMLGPLFAVFSDRIGGDVLDITIAWATYLIVSGVLNILLGNLSDIRFSKEKLMVVGYGLNAVFTFGYLLVNDPFGLFIVQAGLGIASALATPTWYALLSEYTEKGRGGFTWGITHGSSEIIDGIAVIIGGLIVSMISFEALFLTMGMIQIIATIYQARILKK